MTKVRKLISFDWAIKRLLRNKANFDILEGFLSELLSEDVKIVSVLESESNKEQKDDKSNKVDLVVEDSEKEIIIIEIQHETEYDYLHRIAYGTSKLLIENIDAGMPYSKIKKIISISIVYFDLGQGEDYIYKGFTQFEGLNKHDILELSSTQKVLFKVEKISDIYPEYYLIKVNQFDDIARNTLDEWIYFLKNEEIKEEFKAKGLKKASTELDILKLNDEERKAYERFMENLRYQASMVESSYGVGKLKGKQEGIEEGIKKGGRNKTLDMARKSLKEGLQVELISKITGLSKEEIEKL